MTDTLRTPTRTRLAIRRQSASLARPSSGGALTRTISTPSRSPTISVALARGVQANRYFAAVHPLSLLLCVYYAHGTCECLSAR